MPSTKATGSTGLTKRSVVLHGHATSVALEPAFWAALSAWAEEEGLSLAGLIAAIDRGREAGTLASAIRVAVLDYAFRTPPAR
ncbi:ribbon-helix-helix domain-containing protein [Acuticoccus mangrovi]|uniref:Ribbon-helix-helix domain-containing protein n=1 Tax=Acuticoccus mangrovi TaxID=2796142 RepID=A0A934MFK8_9HYPH|nr:ribbon-helix-helix domain-containing protein [Acuticoccus mangrovi]MBJ3775030.1 ribbon-helix-helix domain-containing protein [Acuticoccus mangrovi]